MKGFFVLESEDNNPTDTDQSYLEQAKDFKSALTQRGISLGTSVSYKRWARELKRCHKRHGEVYPTVFGFYLERLISKEKFYFPAQSPSGFLKHFPSIQQRMLEYKEKNDFTIPEDTYNDEIEDMLSEIVEDLPGYPVPESKLKYALWELCDFMSYAVDTLNDLELKPSGLPASMRDSLVHRIQYWRKWFPLYVKYLKSLSEWKEWGHQLPKTKLSMSRTSLRSRKLLKQILEQINPDQDMKAKSRLWQAFMDADDV
jgi:hypothetical protein